ncbi:hypothetical protein P5P81_16200 [Tritonibacter mobilis]|nr:hypothetical protein [Tritonibacter mobilis]
MQKLRRPVFLLSDAATAYIRRCAPLSGPATTHWQDLRALRETGEYPTLTDSLVAENAGILTSAGGDIRRKWWCVTSRKSLHRNIAPNWPAC